MKFRAKRYAVRILLPILLLLALAGAATYNLLLSQAPWFQDLVAESMLSFPARVQAPQALIEANIPIMQDWLAGTHLMLGMVQLIILVLAGVTQLRRPFIHRLFIFAALAQLLLWIPTIYLMSSIPGVLAGVEGLPFDDASREEFLVHYASVFFIIIAIQAAWLIVLGLRETRNLYWRITDPEPDWGDEVLENLRSHGATPGMRLSSYYSLMAHVFVLFIIPWLLTLRGCVEPYRLPKGTGATAVEQVQQVKVVKVKKKYHLNMNSSIIFKVMETPDDKVMEDLNEITKNTYEATSGKMGGGKPGAGPPGWPEGLENAKIRFIRLKYGGGQDWDQDMGDGADYNFLIKFGQLTKFKIAKGTEAIDAYQLHLFPKGQSPPFLYITGGKRGGSIALAAKERKYLRQYLLEEGGMLFADAGGSGFDRPFRAMIQQVLPESQYRMVTLSRDDPIFQSPFMFPNGSPPFWHHAGKDAFGIRDSTGRLICFYHPGDINDAWKTGHSGASKEDAELAYKLGVNVVQYAFVNYYRLHYEQ